MPCGVRSLELLLAKFFHHKATFRHKQEVKVKKRSPGSNGVLIGHSLSSSLVMLKVSKPYLHQPMPAFPPMLIQTVLLSLTTRKALANTRTYTHSPRFDNKEQQSRSHSSGATHSGFQAVPWRCSPPIRPEVRELAPPYAPS